MTDIVYEWDGEAMVPLPRHMAQANEDFVVGYRYVLEAFTPQDQRSRRQHGFYFVQVNEYWQNLPERFHNQPWAASAEFLRHKALIDTGHFNVRTYHCKTNAEALRWVALLPMPVNEKGEALYHERSVDSTVLVERTPKSQAYRTMKKAEFQKSSNDVLEFLSELVKAEVGEVAA